METINLCLRCKNYIGNWKCKAYEKGIPNEILFSEIWHIKPYENDNGIIFQPKTKNDEKIINLLRA